VQRAAWQDLPPLPHVLTPTPPIAPLDAFTASLVTRRDPSFLAPLGHLVDPDGPSGHVDGLARPEPPRTLPAGARRRRKVRDIVVAVRHAWTAA